MLPEKRFFLRTKIRPAPTAPSDFLYTKEEIEQKLTLANSDTFSVYEVVTTVSLVKRETKVETKVSIT